MDVHLRSAFHPLLGRVRIGASRVRPLSPELHTSDYAVACPGSSTWVDKVPSRDTPSLNLAGHRGDVALDAPQVARSRSSNSRMLSAFGETGVFLSHASGVAPVVGSTARRRSSLASCSPETPASRTSAVRLRARARP